MICSGSRRSAFTLVEIALALGIAAFALVAILGMIPMAVDAARESQIQTRATFIAQTLLSNYRGGEPGKGVVETSPGTWTSTPFPPEGSPLFFTFAYDEDGTLLGNAGDYDSGNGMPTGTIYLARLSVTTLPEGVAKLEARVETPASAARDNRQKYSFVTMVRPGFILPTP